MLVSIIPTKLRCVVTYDPSYCDT